MQYVAVDHSGPEPARITPTGSGVASLLTTDGDVVDTQFSGDLPSTNVEVVMGVNLISLGLARILHQA